MTDDIVGHFPLRRHVDVAGHDDSRPRRAVDAARPAVVRPVAVRGLSVTERAPVRRMVAVRGRHGPVLPTGHTLEDPPPAAFEDDVEQLIKVVDDTTSQAMNQVINRPLFTGLAALVDASGYLTLWVEKMKEAVTKGYGTGRAAAQFGYAIETLTTHLLGDSAAGWALSYQVAAGSTRPDIVATKAGRTVWLDLTADSAHSAEHIYTTKQWHLSAVCPHPHVEIGYPPYSTGVMNSMIVNAKLEQAGKALPDQVDTAQLQAQVAAAERKLRKSLSRWRREYVASLTTAAVPADVYESDWPNADERARISVYRWMNAHLRTTFLTTMEAAGDEDHAKYGVRSMRGPRTPPMRGGGAAKGRPTVDQQLATAAADRKRRTDDATEASSILSALGVSMKPYGFVIGAPSRARGIAYLTELDARKAADPTAGTMDVGQ